MDYPPPSGAGNTLGTSATFLESLRGNADPRRWDEFFAIYGPLIGHYLRKMGVAADDVDDLRQDVLIILYRRLADWHYDRAVGSFRGYVKTIVRNAALRYFKRRLVQPRADGGAEHAERLVAAPAAAEEDVFEQAWRRRVFEIACERVRADVSEKTWAMFEQAYLLMRPLTEVAAEFGVRIGNLHVVKKRVKDRLRAEVNALDV
ncbi:MAG TPA: sigma-70 family RNA polymerase sigma factor [Tepidisphaeraceae bacterium]|jgi:RNA polymerase sigma factor (sigma-70 family)|nr:sigma-70 family RNA polymerase sigma factor [Tepidisphaeraceae bacterium]